MVNPDPISTAATTATPPNSGSASALSQPDPQVSEEEQRGLRLFTGRGMCLSCHDGPHLSDGRAHNTGLAWQPADERLGTPGRFLDRGAEVISGRASERGAFKTPTLREVARTAPYMHDGSLATLEEVVDFYDRGGRPNPNLDREMHPLEFTEDAKKALVAFMKTLTAGE